MLPAPAALLTDDGGVDEAATLGNSGAGHRDRNCQDDCSLIQEQLGVHSAATRNVRMRQDMSWAPLGAQGPPRSEWSGRQASQHCQQREIAVVKLARMKLLRNEERSRVR